MAKKKVQPTVTARDIKRANDRFDDEFANDFPLLAGLLDAEVNEDTK